MIFQAHPYSFWLAISATAVLIIAVIIWRRSTSGSFSLRGMLLGMFIWGTSYALTWALVPLEQKIVWLKIMYLGVVMVPGFFLFFTLQITQREHWITFRSILLLVLQPALMFAIVWLMPQRVFASIEPAVRDGYQVMEVARGQWYIINMLYSYTIIAISFVLLLTGYRTANPFFKRQYMLIMLGSIIPVIFSIYTQIRDGGFNDLDLTPVSFGLSSFVYAYAIFRHRFMDLVPVARGRLIENMSDGVLVLDPQGRIVDINPAMENFLEAPPASFIGKNVSEALNIWNESTEHLMTGLETRTELRLPNNASRYLDLRVTPLFDDDKHLSGRLIIFRDVTDRKEVENDLRHAMDRLQSQLIEIGLLQKELREQAIRDALTNLFNRRYLDETLERELARAAREGYPLCIVMMDIDHFKDVNDTYGHEAGDTVLRELSKMVTKQSRQGDFVCRYGGEEFVLVMPNISIDIAKERADSLLRSISSLFVSFGRFNLNITVSMGVSWFPEHGETRDDLLRTADKALYAAKNKGRNQAVVYQNLETEEDDLPSRGNVYSR
ncbi:MAG TPA: diguanylate cyclase [Anaerolineales bacterium]|nr:diguanylate cyclase [Anaerolineales bacterium]